MKAEETSPQTMVAIVIAAHRAGNRELEREMRRRLEQDHRVKVRFLKGPANRKAVQP